MIRLLATAALSIALVVAGCGGDDDAETTAADPPAEEQPAPDPTAAQERERADGEAAREEARGVVISAADSEVGEALFDGDDQAIYYFDLEETSEPECYGSCAEAWPPVLTRGEPRADGAVRQGLVGTTERRDGSLQATYDGRPLYYYVDEGPGELRCHNIFHEGGLWLAVHPDGRAVPHDPAATISLD